MRIAGLGLAVAAWSVAAGGAWAACTPEGPAAKAFTTREFSERVASLLVVSGTLMQMDAYAAKNLKPIKPVCEVATLENGKTAYVVNGTADAALPRIMTPKDRKAPLFFLMTVPDIAGVLPKSNAPAGPLGYALASRDDRTALVFRAYDAVPPDLQLASDLGAVLEGRVPAMLSVDLKTHAVRISTAKGAGEATER